MNRTQLQQLAADRILDAEALLAAGRWAGAYYLGGYAVECGLKACILAYVENNPHIIFSEKGFQTKCWTHKIQPLVEAAGLKAQRTADSKANTALGKSWLVVNDWNEGFRYKQVRESRARKLHSAITHNTDGVLPWIRARW